jgi:hypothetical protein
LIGMSRTERATEARMQAKDERIATRLKERGWQVSPPSQPTWCCPAHGQHPHDGATCLDCYKCRPCADGRCIDPAAHAEGGHDV